MEEFSIEIERRAERGKGAANRMRRQGQIPAIVYFRGEQSVSATLNAHQFGLTALKAHSSSVFALKSSDGVLNGKKALIKEIQKDYLHDTVLHVDFQGLTKGVPIKVKVPLKVIGEAPGVKIDGGMIAVATHELLIECDIDSIPAGFDLDVSQLRINQSIHAEDLKLPAGVKLLINPKEALVSVVEARAIKIEEEAAAAPAEGEAAAAAPVEGAEAAEADKKEKKDDKKGAKEK